MILIIFGLIYLISLKACSNYFVCLTNKRIIIRSGTFSNSYRQYSIDNVTGNITTTCFQSIWDKKDCKEASCKIIASIELLPVGHDSVDIYTNYSITNGYEMAKDIEKVIKSNAKIERAIIKE